ncbi:hypothetical protein O181_012586 [Austropuccinia psidii MF-1]|uniref:BED-type domain-containing protein n=1 Tax=Austropuccinia psidii MF-1 TaxID=1389203 RepID=A0A9Q3GMG1_9BASI|nr:hypothetical protein [Austropuccinia psidii MF-1]
MPHGGTPSKRAMPQFLPVAGWQVIPTLSASSSSWLGLRKSKFFLKKIEIPFINSNFSFKNSTFFFNITMLSKSNGNWQPPSKVHGPRWHGFLMSHLNSNSNSNWRQAKCTYCLHIFQDARPHKLFAHLKDSCLKIPVDKRIKYLHNVLQQSTINDSGEIFDTQSSARASTPASNLMETSLQTSHPNTSSSASYF